MNTCLSLSVSDPGIGWFEKTLQLHPDTGYIGYIGETSISVLPGTHGCPRVPHAPFEGVAMSDEFI